MWELFIFAMGVGTGWVVFEKPEWVHAAVNWVKAKLRRS